MENVEPGSTPVDESSPATREQRRFAIVAPRRAWVSPTIVALNVLVFAAMVVSGVPLLQPSSLDLLKWGADHGPLVAAGEWWRLLTNAFVHVGVLHIGLNMWVFRSLGPAVERLYGNAAFAVVYLASALGASIASTLTHPAIISAGASGAIFGVAGAFLAFFLGHRREMPTALFRTMMRSLLTFVVVNSMFGFLVPGIDNAAHLGGLLTGFVGGLLLDRDVSASPVFDGRRILRAIVLFAAILGAALFIPARVRGDDRSLSELFLRNAQEALEREDWDRAVSLADEQIATDPKSAQAWLVRAFGRFGRGEQDVAADLDRALELDDGLERALHFRAALREEARDVRGALRDHDRLVELRPSEPLVFVSRAHARYAAEDWAGALRDFQTAVGLEDPEVAANAHLYMWVLRSRVGTRAAATEELRHAVESSARAGWDPTTLRIAAFLLGDLSDTELQSSGDRAESSEIEYFIGVKYLLDGDRESARDRFVRCLASDRSDPNAAWHAQTELASLPK